MALPKIAVARFGLELPSSSKRIQYRPFLVKEEKVLLMAAQSDDSLAMIEAVKDVINACTDDVDVNVIPYFDLEYLFLNLRARSVSEVSNLKFTCNNLVKDAEAEDGEKKCGSTVEIDVNLLDVDCQKNPEHTNKVELTNKVGIIMKYPTFNSINLDDLNSENIDKIVDVIISCIDYIYDENNLMVGAGTWLLTGDVLTGEFAYTGNQTQFSFTSIFDTKTGIVSSGTWGFNPNVTGLATFTMTKQ